MFRIVMLSCFLVSLLLFSGTLQALMTLHPLESPNKDFKMVITNGPFGNTIGFAVFYKGKQIAFVSRLVFEFADDANCPLRQSLCPNVCETERHCLSSPQDSKHRVAASQPLNTSMMSKNN